MPSVYRYANGFLIVCIKIRLTIHGFIVGFLARG